MAPTWVSGRRCSACGELVDAASGVEGPRGIFYCLARCAAWPALTPQTAGVPEPFLAAHYMKVLCPIPMAQTNGTHSEGS